MDKKRIIFNIALVMIVIIIVVSIFYIIKNKASKVRNSQTSNNDIVSNSSYAISDETSNRIITEMKSEFESTTDKVVLYLNEEAITEKDIAFKRYQLNNSAVDTGSDDKDVMNEIITDYVICQNAEELNISLSERDIKKIENTPNLEEDTKKLAEAANMTYDDFNEMYVNMEKRALIETKWTAYVGEKIVKGELKVSSKIFEEKYKEYNKTENIGERSKLLLELLELYKQYLVEQAEIEYVN